MLECFIINQYILYIVSVDTKKSEKPNKVSKRKSTDGETKESSKRNKTEPRSKQERRRSETKVEIDGQIETHTTLSPKTPPGDPPEPEELIKVSLLFV